ncbi:MAG TPA: cytochrome-c peroxidase [Pyrinomonadaceae bacterium]|nr:cytochrome-c peroxidase [Pyrinomonadaceae bacterium]
MKQSLQLILVAVPVIIAIGWWQHNSHSPTIASQQVVAQSASDEPITPLPLDLKLDPAKVALGEQLFHDPVLSHNNKISCASCHSLTSGAGTDQLVHSIGIDGKQGDINAPTVFNAGLNFVQFWDGRAATLEEQIDGPMGNPSEMGSSWPEALQKLQSSAFYVDGFAAIYNDGIQTANVRDAIATFERSLITPNSRFDRYLRGEQNALTSEALEGYRLFKDYGCASCHQGAGVGGNLFEKFGVMNDYFAQRGNITKTDFGRFNVTKNEADKYVFKVPSLRNVALTGPYFHDGSAASLEEAVRIMSLYQLGRTLTPDETDSIVRFLRSLSGEYKGQAL